ncbi:MAG: hypothetical protein IPL32_18075 [Chloracidobacterium sp.]|nr:hypothetical protein [Chloracidobacterium sp.]
MTYITPITDRSENDIKSRTAKAFFNVADWQRIYNNAQVTKTLVDLIQGGSILFDTLPSITITTIPTVTELNTLLANIERIRVEANLPAIPGLTSIFAEWGEGVGSESPDYLDVNEWEQVLDLIYNLVPNAGKYYVWCGVASAGQTRFYQSQWRKHPELE